MRPRALPCPSPSSAIHTSRDRKSTRLNSSHVEISYAVFCLKKKNQIQHTLIGAPFNLGIVEFVGQGLWFLNVSRGRVLIGRVFLAVDRCSIPFACACVGNVL